MDKECLSNALGIILVKTGFVTEMSSVHIKVHRGCDGNRKCVGGNQGNGFIWVILQDRLRAPDKRGY